MLYRILFVMAFCKLSCTSKENFNTDYQYIDANNIIDIFKRLGGHSYHNQLGESNEVDSKQNLGDTSAVGVVSRSRSRSNHHPSNCEPNLQSGVIIKATDSIKAGAEYIDSIKGVTSNSECINHCCQNITCDVAVYQDKSERFCYLFKCDGKCVFKDHEGYFVSNIRHVKEQTEEDLHNLNTESAAQGEDSARQQGAENVRPQGQYRERPQGQYRERPQGQDSETPQGKVNARPQGQDSERPQGQDNDRPQGQERPQGQDSDRPQGQDNDRPQGQERPQGEDSERPQGNVNAGPQGEDRSSDSNSALEAQLKSKTAQQTTLAPDPPSPSEPLDPVITPHSVGLKGFCTQSLHCEDPNGACIDRNCLCKKDYYNKDGICRKVCPPSNFECFELGTLSRGPECVPRTQVCDSYMQCADGSDEFNCEDLTAGQRLTKPNALDKSAMKSSQSIQAEPVAEQREEIKPENPVTLSPPVVEVVSTASVRTTGSVSQSPPPTPTTSTTTLRPAHDGHRANEHVFMSSEKVIIASATSNAEGPIIALSLGLAFTVILLVLVGCRLRNVRHRLRKGRPLHQNEADYLINGMYL